MVASGRTRREPDNVRVREHRVEFCHDERDYADLVGVRCVRDVEFARKRQQLPYVERCSHKYACTCAHALRMHMHRVQVEASGFRF